MAWKEPLTMTYSKCFNALASMAIGLTVVCNAFASPDSCGDCGKNARMVGDGVVFDELVIDGSPSTTPRITSAAMGDTPARLEVIEDELFAYVDGARLEKGGLVGLVFTVESRYGEHEVQIKSYFDK